MTASTQLTLPGNVSRTGLQLPESLSFDDWQRIGTELKRAGDGLMWWLGDWLRHGERSYGEKYSSVAANYATAADAKWVAGRFEFSDRSENLSWTHHRLAAGLDAPEERAALLAKAEAENWSVREMRAAINRSKAQRRIGDAAPVEPCTVADLYSLVERGAKFGTIYADPPWLYDNQSTRAATSNHYGGMTVNTLCELPVRQLAADDAHLHLWTTNGFLFEAPKIFDAWGFEFRSSFVWVKTQMGIGNYWRNSHEILLTAVRGNAKRFNDHSLMSWLECERSHHSEKPEQVRSFIERASPGPRLELFGRKAVEGWCVWGNQVERSLFTREIEVAA